MTPEVELPAQPKMFKNPHVEEKKADPKKPKTTKASESTTALTPTLNPFVNDAAQVASR